ncbi:protein NUCLEAR FUSION DEFECTIVE 6, mitochondrial-like isoform X2 [Rutidosis leptorrhynchoides]|uniref:protein NUCLEAR FUSION DEFECTIVE 6, mitochondrial-like isoform X1 n=1 Tax=Rutidosis leptorrhynchoides TaxID=125765 RepID=UPI003A9A37DA
MSGGAAAVRFFTRSTSVRSVAGKFSAGAKSSPFRFPSIKPNSNRIFRCPVELSACLDTVQPFHTVTSSALMTSMLIFSRASFGWLPEGS